MYLNNAWDMTSASDIDSHDGTSTNAGIATIPAPKRKPARRSVTSLRIRGQHDRRVRSGPVRELLPSRRSIRSYRDSAAVGAHRSIKYRILTAEMGLPNKPRDLCGGSIVRVGLAGGRREVELQLGDSAQQPRRRQRRQPLQPRYGGDCRSIRPALRWLRWTPGTSAFPGMPASASIRTSSPSRPVSSSSESGWPPSRKPARAIRSDGPRARPAEPSASTTTRTRTRRQDVNRIDGGHVHERQLLRGTRRSCRKGGKYLRLRRVRRRAEHERGLCEVAGGDRCTTVRRGAHRPEPHATEFRRPEPRREDAGPAGAADRARRAAGQPCWNVTRSCGSWRSRRARAAAARRSPSACSSVSTRSSASSSARCGFVSSGAVNSPQGVRTIRSHGSDLGASPGRRGHAAQWGRRIRLAGCHRLGDRRHRYLPGHDLS